MTTDDTRLINALVTLFDATEKIALETIGARLPHVLAAHGRAAAQLLASYPNVALRDRLLETFIEGLRADVADGILAVDKEFEGPLG